MSPVAANLLLLIALLLMMAAAVARYAVSVIFDARLALKARNLEALTKELEGIRAEASELEAEYALLRPRSDRLRRELVMTRRQLAEVDRERYAVVQLLGQPGEDRIGFLYELFYQPVEGRFGRSPFDLRFWTHRSFVEVWADSAQTAERQLGISFDSKAGYRRSALIQERRIGPPPRPGGQNGR